MPKGQQKGNREHKKPKQVKAKPAAATSSFSGMQPRPAANSPGKKR
jgi:hypothetical protein